MNLVLLLSPLMQHANEFAISELYAPSLQRTSPSIQVYESPPITQ